MPATSKSHVLARSTAVDRRRFLTALAAAAMGAPSLAGCLARSITRPTRRWNAVQAWIDGYVRAGKLAGAAVGVSYFDGPPAYLSAGMIALDSTQRFDENSICRIYSMTKPVTGMAAMCLVEEGRIRLDQPVAEVLPELASLRVAIDLETGLESRPAVNTMTMRHLLTHTNGFAYWSPAFSGVLPSAYREHGITPGNYDPVEFNRPGHGPQAKGLADMVKRLAALPLAFEPGTAWAYSLGLDVMGLVIERVTGKGLDVFLHDRLFVPLCMDSTGFQVAPRDVGRLTTNYTITPEGLKPKDVPATSTWRVPSPLLAGGAGLLSTVRDFTRFGAMLLGEGQLDGKRVMKPETVRLARSNLLPPGVAARARDGGQSGFAAGAQLVVPDAPSPLGPGGTLSHGGASGTLWLVDPARRGNFVFMSQHYPPQTYPNLLGEATAAIGADLEQHG